MNTPAKPIAPKLDKTLTLELAIGTKPTFNDDNDLDGTEDEEDRFWNEFPKRPYRKQRSALTTHGPTRRSDPDAKEEREWSASEDETYKYHHLKFESTTSRTLSDVLEKRKRGRPRKDNISDKLSSSKRTCVMSTGPDGRKTRGRTSGPDPNRTDKTGRTKLFYFTGAGHFDKVRHLVSLGADVNFKDNAGWTPLHEAALKGQLEIAQFLISHGADANARGFGDETPLHDAACNGHVDCVRLLLDKGADVFARNTDKQTPLDVCDDEESRKTLREKMMKLDRLITRDASGRTTLHGACINDFYDDVTRLLEQGANANTKDNLGRTPLHEAVANGRIEIAKLLIRHGADINDADCNGDTILHSACRHGHVHVARYLIDSGVVVHVSNCDGKSAYDVTECATVRQILAGRMDEERQQRATSHAIDEVTFVSATQRHKRTSGIGQGIARDGAPSRQLSREERKIQAIMRSFEAIEKQPQCRGRSGSAATESGRDERSASPAETAMIRRTTRQSHHRQNSCPTESCLREGSVDEGESRPTSESKKYDPHKKDSSGRTQLHKHATRGDVSAVEALLQAGADPNEKDHAGWTALHEAALHGRLEVMLLLLKNGANVNSKGADLDTPLHDATENGHADGVKLLLEHGADPHACNAKGTRPADIAVENDNRHIQQLILAYCNRQGQVKKRRLVPATLLECRTRDTKKKEDMPVLKRSPINVDLHHDHHRHEPWMRLKAQMLPFAPLSPDGSGSSRPDTTS